MNCPWITWEYNYLISCIVYIKYWLALPSVTTTPWANLQWEVTGTRCSTGRCAVHSGSKPKHKFSKTRNSVVQAQHIESSWTTLYNHTTHSMSASVIEGTVEYELEYSVLCSLPTSTSFWCIVSAPCLPSQSLHSWLVLCVLQPIAYGHAHIGMSLVRGTTLVALFICSLTW